MWTRIKRTLRIHLLAFIIMILTPSKVYNSEPYDVMKADVIRFEKHHDRFVRNLFGCSATGEISSKYCHAESGILSYGDYNAARKAAAKLYSLKLE